MHTLKKNDILYYTDQLILNNDYILLNSIDYFYKYIEIIPLKIEI